MNWFLNLTTQRKLIAAFVLLITLLVAVIVTAERQMDAVQQASTIAEKLSTMTGNVNEQRAAIMSMIASADPAKFEAQRQLIERNKAENDSLLAQVRALYAAQGEQSASLERFVALRAEYNSVRDQQILPLLLSGKIDQARVLEEGAQRDRYVKVRDASNELESRAAAAASAAQRRALLVFTVAGASAVIVAVLVVILLTRMIARPLGDMAATAERIAGGDLSISVRVLDRRDEVGVLSGAFVRMIDYLKETAAAADNIAAGNLKAKVIPRSDKDLLGQSFARMVENLQKLTSELTEGVNVLATSASEISTSTTQLAANASQTATAVTETTTTVEEVKQTAHLATQKARGVADSAQRAAQSAQTGRKAIEDTNANMTRIRAQMEAIAASMVRLTEQSHAIGHIIATVDDLAAQSNLLAVNAAIEAAKAGEQGKGFAVVAQEVKSLAEQSRQATNQVRTILNDIQRATTAAVMATEQGGKAVEAGFQQSRETGEAIVTLAGSVSEAAQASTQIAASSQQQLVGVDQVASAIDSIKEATGQNVDSAKMLETAAGKLSELGQTLKQLVGRFQL